MEEIDKNISSKEYEKKVDLSYALGKAFENIKDYEKSFF